MGKQHTQGLVIKKNLDTPKKLRNYPKTCYCEGGENRDDAEEGALHRELEYFSYFNGKSSEKILEHYHQFSIVINNRRTLVGYLVFHSHKFLKPFISYIVYQCLFKIFSYSPLSHHLRKHDFTFQKLHFLPFSPNKNVICSFPSLCVLQAGEI